MNSRFLQICILVSMLVASMLASGAEIEVTLAPLQQTVKRGETPRFAVTVKAIAAVPRIMKFADRQDLRDNYAELIVTRGGKRIEVPRAISDPGPTGENDYLRLGPGKSVKFEHDGQPYMLSALASGTYSATVKLRTDWGADAVMSNHVSFTVEQR